MKKSYERVVIAWLVIFLPVIVFGQQTGIIKTDRSAPPGIVSFTQSAKLTDISDTRHVDGYVKKYGNSLLTFPVGQNGLYRPFAADGDGVNGAYFRGDPGTAALPGGAPFNTANRDGAIAQVNAKEYWDINGTGPSKITLTWAAGSNLSALIGTSLNLLTIVGWNQTLSKWEKIGSSIDQVSLFGGVSSVSSGSITSVETIVPDKYNVYAIGSLISPNTPADYTGILEIVECTEVSGWVWDKNHPEGTMTIELIEGSNVIVTALANSVRSDLQSAGTGTGKYGFRIPLPVSLMDDMPHQLSVRVRGSNYLLGGSPKTVSCGYGGSFETADCVYAKGWAWDKNYINTTHTVELVEGSTVHAVSSANLFRSDLKDAGKGTGNYGYSLLVPAVLRDGRPHEVSVRIKDINYVVQGSPKTINCPLPQYDGKFDWVDCNTFGGWVWDSNNPDAFATVELVEGNTVVATAIANSYRESLKTAGIGTGKYAFSMNLPASVKDGNPHQLSIRVKGTSVILRDSPKVITCSVNQYAGRFEWIDCNSLGGWAWDKNNPNAAVVVELVEGSQVLATATAATYRADIKNAGYGTGNYGFNIPLPASVRDGQPHQLSVRVQGSSSALTDSPKSITCPVNQYLGRFEWVDCNTLGGYAWDKNNPNAAVTVEVLEGSAVLGTVVASTYRADVKNAGNGTGNYGFSMPLPASLRDGKAHQLSVRVKGGTALLQDSPRSVTCQAKQYAGSFDWVDCNTLGGWAWDKNDPNAALNVELVEGSTVLATMPANIYRESLKTSGIGTGNYAFRLEVPSVLRDGQAHQLSVRIQGSTFVLSNSPKSITCPVNQYLGRFEWVDCNTLGGYAWDKNNPNAAVTVELLEGSAVLGTVVASTYRADVKNAGNGTGNYGFSMPLPASLRDGKAHQLSVRVKGGTALLQDSPRSVTCQAKQYAGSFDWVDCNTLGGWAWDKNDPNAALNVELVEGSTVLATMPANIYRESLKTSGIGTGNYAFRLEVPSVLRDGQAHQLSVRIQGSTFVLSNSPKSITCPVNQYLGRFEWVDCNTLGGYAWDKNNPNAAVTVELLEGSAVLGTVVASTYRADVKNAGNGTGNYGFSMPLPASLRDGKAHQLSVRVKGGTALLQDSPRSVTCQAKQYAGSFDWVDCNTLGGWAWDKNDPNAALNVELVEGSTVLATMPANIYRESLKTSGIGTGNYAFRLEVPSVLRDGQAHQLSVRIQGSTFVLSNSPKSITCPVNQYLGRFEWVDCNTLGGYAWDKNNPNAAVTVELLEGSAVLGTVVASTYRADVKNAGNGTGNYGFSMPLPASLRDGKAHQLSVRVKGGTALLQDSPRSVTCQAKQYAGSFDWVDCNTLGGWAWDKNDPNAALNVELVEGSTVLATMPANIYRESLKTSGIGTGNYAFRLEVPSVLRDGQAHQLSVRIQGSTFVLSNSPKSITCPVNQYLGRFEWVDCNTLGGYAWDKNNPNAAVTVELLEGSAVLGTVVASTYRADVKNAGNGTGNYGFSMPLPASLRDGKAHQLSVRVKGGTALLQSSPRAVTCPATARIASEDDSTKALSGQRVVESNSNSLQLMVYPNPAVGNVLVSFKTQWKGLGRLSIVNIYGRQVWSETVLSTGEEVRKSIDLRQNSDGIYLITLNVGDQKETRRLIIAR